MFSSPSCYQSYVWDTSHYPIKHRHICKMLTKLNLKHFQQMCNDWTPVLQNSTFTLWPALGQMHPGYHVCPVIRPSDRSQWAICPQQNEKRKEVLPDAKPHLPMEALHIASAKSPKWPYNPILSTKHQHHFSNSAVQIVVLNPRGEFVLLSHGFALPCGIPNGFLE